MALSVSYSASDTVSWARAYCCVAMSPMLLPRSWMLSRMSCTSEDWRLSKAPFLACACAPATLLMGFSLKVKRSSQQSEATRLLGNPLGRYLFLSPLVRPGDCVHGLSRF